MLSVWSVATTESRMGVRAEAAGKALVDVREPLSLGGMVVSELQLLLGFMALTAAGVFVCQLLFEVGGLWFSRTILGGKPFGNPLEKRKTMVLPLPSRGRKHAALPAACRRWLMPADGRPILPYNDTAVPAVQ